MPASAPKPAPRRPAGWLRFRSQPSRQATVGILSDSRIPDSQAAVAQALADAPTPDRDPSFVDPLFTMLQTPGTPGLKAAQALGIYKIGPAHDKQVLPRLIGTATGAAAVRTDTIRANATLALGQMVDLEAAQTLMDLLTAPNESAEVRDNAAKSLAAMSGNTRIGTDPQGWQSWWATQPKNPAEFHDNILAAQASQLATLKRQYSDTQSSFSTFVDRSYHSITDLQARGTKLLEYLTSPDPIIRAESARIVHDDKAYGVPLPPAEQMQAAQAQLQKMVGDPEPQVRLAAADAIAVLNDRSALKLLIAQLDREEDPGVKAALARRWGRSATCRRRPRSCRC